MLTIQVQKADIIACESALEAIALRSVLEDLGIEVSCHFVGHINGLIGISR